jgi:hypothetical protein
MKSIHIVVLIALAALVMAILMTAPAHAEPSKSKKPAATEKSPKKKKGSAPKFVNSSSQETTAERDRRLYRECKGRPNAGACSGYAS